MAKITSEQAGLQQNGQPPVHQTAALPSIYGWRSMLRFALPSVLGVLFFLVPIEYDGKSTIAIAVITDTLKALVGDIMLAVVVGICMVTALLSVLYSLIRPAWLPRPRLLTELFDTSPAWLLCRLAGAVFGVMYFFQWGPELIIGRDTGGAAFVDIGINMTLVFVTACLLLPLLTDFGFMEFVGTLVRPLFQRLFRLPGRSAIDATASFVAAASVGVLITIAQYERGFYSAREAAVVATNFSVVSIPFALVVATVAGVDHIFFPWYGTVVLACLVAAVITPRLPPLSRKPDSYRTGGGPQLQEKTATAGLWRTALVEALEVSHRSPGAAAYCRSAGRALAEVVFGVVAAAMGLIVLSMIVALHTPLFTWLSYPLISLLELFQVAEAQAAAPGMLVGFLDQFLPAVIAQQLQTEMTRFVLAGLSICQLIYLSEVGVLLLRSSLPLTLWDLALIFLLRTLIALPVFVLVGHWLY